MTTMPITHKVTNSILGKARFIFALKFFWSRKLKINIKKNIDIFLHSGVKNLVEKFPRPCHLDKEMKKIF